MDYKTIAELLDIDKDDWEFLNSLECYKLQGFGTNEAVNRTYQDLIIKRLKDYKEKFIEMYKYFMEKKHGE